MRTQKDVPARRRLDTYPSRFEARTLFSDMDVFRHLNNGAIGRFFEEGRASLNIGVFGQECFTGPSDGAQLLFVNVTTDFLAQAHYPGMLVIGTGVTKIGTSSYSLAQAGFQDGRCFAVSESVLVKAMNGRPTPLTELERTALHALSWRAPDAA